MTFADLRALVEAADKALDDGFAARARGDRTAEEDAQARYFDIVTKRVPLNEKDEFYALLDYAHRWKGLPPVEDTREMRS